MENIEIASLSNSIQNVNHGSDLKTKLLLSVSSDTIEKIEESNKKVNKSYKKKRKKKKKSIKQSQSQALDIYNNNKQNNSHSCVNNYDISVTVQGFICITINKITLHSIFY